MSLTARPSTARPVPPSGLPPSHSARRPSTARGRNGSFAADAIAAAAASAEDERPLTSTRFNHYYASDHMEMESAMNVVKELRSSVGSRYSEFKPPPSPFRVLPRPENKVIRKLYDVIDGKYVEPPVDSNADRPMSVAENICIPEAGYALPLSERFPEEYPAAAASNASAHTRPVSAVSLQSNQSRPESAHSRHYYAQYDREASRIAHNFTDGSAKIMEEKQQSQQTALASSSALPPTHPQTLKSYSTPFASKSETVAEESAASSGAANDDDDIPLNEYGVPTPRKPRMRFGDAADMRDLTMEERKALRLKEAQLQEALKKHQEELAAAAAAASASNSAHNSRPQTASTRPTTAKRRSKSPNKTPAGGRTPLYASRPGSARTTAATPSAAPTPVSSLPPDYVDQPFKARNKLWTKFHHSSDEEKAALFAEMNDTHELDAALHIKGKFVTSQLHHASANHALQGMKLVSEDGIAAMEAAAALSDDEDIPESVQVIMATDNLSDEDMEVDSEEEREAEERANEAIRQQIAMYSGQVSQDTKQSSLFDGNDSAAPTTPIDFARVGIEVSRRLKAQGFPLSQSHLDVMHSLPLLERVWLASSSRGFGLNEAEFVEFLCSASNIHKPTLSVLFEKMDINSKSRLSWDEYLSYLVKEMSHFFRMNAGAGTFIVTQDDSRIAEIISDTATVISQMIVLPQVGNVLFPTYTSKIVARCKNDTVQVFDTNTFQYLYHVPLHAPVKKRKKVWSYGDEDKRLNGNNPNVADQDPMTMSRPQTASSTSGKIASLRPQDEKVLLYNVESTYPTNGPLKAFPIAQTSDHNDNVDPEILAKINKNKGWYHARNVPDIDALDGSADGGDLARPPTFLTLNTKDEEESDEDEDEDDTGEAGRSSSRLSRRPSTAASVSGGGGGGGSHSRGVSKSSNSIGRPASARPGTAGMLANEIPNAEHPQKPFIKIANRPRTAKEKYSSIRDRKLESYLAGLEFISTVPIAQPLACVGQLRDSGRPPPAEKPNAGGIAYRNMLELANRNRPYSFPLTAVAHLPLTKQIVVAAQDRSLRFYGLVRRVFECQSLFYVHETPQCLELDTLTPNTFAGMHGQFDRTLAIVGCFTGTVSAYHPTTYARIANLPNLHMNQTVKKVQLFPHVGLITAGMDGRLSIVDPCTFQVSRFLGKVVDESHMASAATTGHTSTAHGHNSGVFSFAVCPTTRTLLSVGFDREVFQWDTHISRPTWKLPTFNADILDVLVNEPKNQIMVVSRDQKIRVFDTRNFKQVQETIDTNEYFPAGKLTACAFDPQKQELLTAANKVSVWKVEPSASNKAALASAHTNAINSNDLDKKSNGNNTHKVQSQTAHISTIVAILFSWAFNQIITVCENESIRVWDIFQGTKGPVFEFHTSHRSQLTAAALDWNGKRLLTACHQGKVCMWNFNNGELLFEFFHFGGGLIEVNKLCLLSTVSQCLVATGWSKNVLRWPAPLTTAKAAASVVTEQLGHSAQILSLAVFGNFIITGDAQGEICSWVADSGHKIHSTTLPKTSQQFKLDIPTVAAATTNPAGANQEAEKKKSSKTRPSSATTNTKATKHPATPASTASPTAPREICAPAITCLQLFLLNDFQSYHTWHRLPLPEVIVESKDGNDPAADVRPLRSHPPDYRQQHFHLHRVALFVGTDDGSFYIMSPQGLTILYSSVHLMPDAVQSMALIQTIELEEIKEVPVVDDNKGSTPGSLAVSRRASLVGGTKEITKLRTPSGALTLSGLEAASKAKTPSASDGADGETPLTDKEKLTIQAGATPRFNNPFTNLKKTKFFAVPKVQAQSVQPSMSEEEVMAAELREMEAAAAAAKEYDANGNEILSLSAQEAMLPTRKPFTSAATFKTSPFDNIMKSKWDKTELDVSDATSLEEYLRIKQSKKLAAAEEERKKVEAEKAKKDKENGGAAKTVSIAPESDKNAVDAKTIAPLAATVAVAAPPKPVVPRLSLVVDALQAASRRYRRVIKTRLLIADAMSGSEAKLFDIFMAPAADGASLYRGSPSIVDQTLGLEWIKSLYLHAPPSATGAYNPNFDDSTTELNSIQHPCLDIQVFLAASAAGRASMWSASGEYLAEFGQSPAKGWPLRRNAPANWNGASTGETTAGGGRWPSLSLMKANFGLSLNSENSRSDLASSNGDEDDGGNWSTDDDEMSPEEERALIRMQAKNMGFAEDDSSIMALLAGVRKKKIMNDNAKKGMAYGPAFTGVGAAIVSKNTAEFGGGALGGPTNSDTAHQTAPTSPQLTERPQTAPRSAREKARFKRIIETPRDRYVSSFRPMSARHAKPTAAVSSNDGNTGGAASTPSASVLDSANERTYAEMHPFYIPETLRAGGLRSAIFLNDTKLRQRASTAQQKAAEQAQNRTRQRDADLRENNDDGISVNFFQLAPRDEAALAETKAARDRALQLDRFLSDSRNFVDEKTGGIKDHGVARLATMIQAVDDKSRRRLENEVKASRPTHVRQASRLAKQHKENVFLRLSHAGGADSPSLLSPRSHKRSTVEEARARAAALKASRVGTPVSTGSQSARPSSTSHHHQHFSYDLSETPLPPEVSTQLASMSARPRRDSASFVPNLLSVRHAQANTQVLLPNRNNISVKEEERLLHLKAVEVRAEAAKHR